MSASDKHNELARRFVMEVVAETRSDSEMMVVIESVILATMLILQKRHGIAPSGCVEMVEMAVHQATDRFSATGARP